MPEKERYAPLNHVDKVKLANHLDQLEIFVVNEIPTLIHNKAYLLPSQFNQNGIKLMVVNLSQLLSQAMIVYVNSFVLGINGFQCIPVLRISTDK